MHIYIYIYIYTCITHAASAYGQTPGSAARAQSTESPRFSRSHS